MNEDIKTIIIDANEHIDVIEIDENENIKNVALKTLLKGAPGENGTDIELIPKIYPESIEENLEPNQVYNGNAIHDLARLFGLEMQNVYAIMPVILPIFDIEYTYEDNEVYNANAIHQLMEIFGFEIMNLVEMIESLEERISTLENK